MAGLDFQNLRQALVHIAERHGKTIREFLASYRNVESSPTAFVFPDGNKFEHVSVSVRYIAETPEKAIDGAVKQFVAELRDYLDSGSGVVYWRWAPEFAIARNSSGLQFCGKAYARLFRKGSVDVIDWERRASDHQAKTEPFEWFDLENSYFNIEPDYIGSVA